MEFLLTVKQNVHKEQVIFLNLNLGIFASFVSGDGVGNWICIIHMITMA